MSRTFGPGPHDLLLDGRRVAAVAVADTARARGRGLLGTTGIEGALWLPRTRSVHMVGMRYPIDVAVLDRDGVVLLTATLRPWLGMTRSRRRARSTLEAAAGSLAAWGVAPGARLAVRRRGAGVGAEDDAATDAGTDAGDDAGDDAGR